MSVRASLPSSAAQLDIATHQFYELRRFDIPDYQKSKDANAIRARLRLVGSLIAELPSSNKARKLAQDLLHASQEIISNPDFWGKLIGLKKGNILLERGSETQKPENKSEELDVTQSIEPLPLKSATLRISHPNLAAVGLLNPRRVYDEMTLMPDPKVPLVRDQAEIYLMLNEKPGGGFTITTSNMPD